MYQKWYHVLQNKTKPCPITAKKFKIEFNNKRHQLYDNELSREISHYFNKIVHNLKFIMNATCLAI